MPVLLAQTEEKIVGTLLNDLTENTGLTRASPGSKVRAFADAVGKKIGLLYTYMDVNIMSAFLSGAQDRYLDFFGQMLGMPRLDPQTASVDSAHKMIKFYTESPNTFGSINGGNSILLTGGTIVSSSSSGGVRYKVLYNAVLPAASSYTYISAIALQDGSAANIGAGRLVYHDFNGYVDYVAGTLLVTNEAEITCGRDIEGDENYRYRLSNALLASEKANLVAVRLAVLQVPGVADLVVESFPRGLGTFDVTIKSVSPVVPAGLISAVEEAIEKVAALGVLPLVKAPVEVGVSMTMTLRLTKVLGGDEKDMIISNVQDNVANYINNLDIGEELVVNEIVQRVMETDTRIKDMGVANKPISTIFIYRPSLLESGKVREELLGNYVAAVDERVIVETGEGLVTPISVIIG